MKQGNTSAQPEPGVTSPQETLQATTTSTTMEIMTAKPGKGRQSVVGFAKLREWPTLAPAVAIHHNLGTPGQFRVPVKLMRKCGMHPELGVHAAVQVDRVLIWGDATGGAHRQDPESKQFFLTRAGVGPRLTQANFAIVEGPDYLIITTRREASKIAGAVPIHAHTRWERLTSKGIERLAEALPGDDIEIRGWQDVKLFHANCRAKTGIAQVAGNLWYMAGFVGGDRLRFTRYQDATVVEKCAEGQQHSILSEAKNGRPRHFFGATLFDLHLTDRVRVVATEGRLIVTLPDSDLGRRCNAPVGKRSQPKQSGPQVLNPDVPKDVLSADGLDVVALKDYDSPNTNLNVYGRIWHAAGIERLQPARVVKYANALVVERCAEGDMEFRIGSPSQALPYRCVSLVGTLLAGASKVRVLVAEGRLVLTTRNSDIGRKFRNAPEWPSKPDDVAPFLAALGYGAGDTQGAEPATSSQAPDTPTPTSPLVAAVAPVAEAPVQADVARPAEVVDVARYACPEGKRLQMQGRWLKDFGFDAGAQYEVRVANDKVFVELGGAETGTVTNYSATSSKLYVPAASLVALAGKEVQVRARKGLLELAAA